MRVLLAGLLSLVCALAVAAAGTPATPLAPASAHKVTCKKGSKAKQRTCRRHVARHAAARRKAAAARRCKRTSCMPAPTPTPTPEPTPTPTPEPTPEPTPTPQPTPTPSTSWRAAGARPLSDAEAAARVRAVAENRAANADENAYRPTADELTLFRSGQRNRFGETAVQSNPLVAHVTGGYAGTTDQILQWAAHKWGIPEDVVRAVAVRESWWNMSQLGDRRTVTDPTKYPAASRIAGTSDVYQSLGIMQIKWTPEGLHQGTEPLRWKSTAFNVDYWASVVRFYFDGLCRWCGAGYGPGQDWASVGGWYNPSPWGNEYQLGYVERVKSTLASRTWASSGF